MLRVDVVKKYWVLHYVPEYIMKSDYISTTKYCYSNYIQDALDRTATKFGFLKYVFCLAQWGCIKNHFHIHIG